MSKPKISQAEFSITANCARRIRELRKRLGLTQAEFATLAGVSLGAQHRYEAATSDPGASYMARLASAGIDVLWLITGLHCTEQLDPESSELVAIFLDLPADMRAGLLTFGRSVHDYVTKHGLGGNDPPPESPIEPRLINDLRAGFRGEVE